MSRTEFRSVLEQVYDVCIVGAGLAGVAAAVALVRQGRSVLLLGPRGLLAWEAGSSFGQHLGSSNEPLWREFHERMTSCGGASDDWLDGALCEVRATAWLDEQEIDTLYYAIPVGVETDEHGCISGLLVGTKAGPRRIVARRWMDATETGRLCRLADATRQERTPTTHDATLFLQRSEWPTDLPNVLGALRLRQTLWSTELAITTECPPEPARMRSRMLDALDELAQKHPDLTNEAQLTHCSLQPYPIYEGHAETAVELPGNVTVASPALCSEPTVTLADRFALGGALAAIAAGREAGHHLGAVVGLDLMEFAGGVGTGGGIHGYYYGLPGGLQDELDRRTAERMEHFGSLLNVKPHFHWFAKMTILDEMMLEAGVATQWCSIVTKTQAENGEIQAVFAVTPAGLVKIQAKSFIDGTGDADLCAQGGATLLQGRQGDMLTHVYSQSSGRLQEVDGRPRCKIVNFDAGWCDPRDPDDFTRARREGVAQYDRPAYENYSRVTYVAPVVGVRQSFQVQTEAIVTFRDLTQGTVPEDVVAYAACHCDNHASDTEFESDDGIFWLWVVRNFREEVACGIPYRALVPRGLRNVWIASRCLGVTQDAHYTIRMQRDLQRTGEAVGYAAMIAARRGVSACEVPYEQLRDRLEQTGALGLPEDDVAPLFDIVGKSSPLRDPSHGSLAPDDLERLRRGETGTYLWRIMLARDQTESAVLELSASEDSTVSWLAAGILARWGLPAAEPRLIRAIRAEEYGYAPPLTTEMSYVHEWKGETPHCSRALVPNWLAAAALLRICGTPRCLDALETLSRYPDHSLDTRAILAMTVERIVRRIPALDRRQAERILDNCLAGEIRYWQKAPPQPTGYLSEMARLGRFDCSDTSPPRNDVLAGKTQCDMRWQLHFVVAKARLAIGLPPQPEAAQYHRDPHGLVRNAFTSLLAEGD